MKIDSEWMKIRYNEFNYRFFDNRCPMPRNGFKVTYSIKTQGSCISRVICNKIYVDLIKMSIKYNKSEKHYEEILLHEMIHSYIAGYLQMWKSGHDDTFIKIMNLINSNSLYHVSIDDTVLDNEVKKENYLLVPCNDNWEILNTQIASISVKDIDLVMKDINYAYKYQNFILLTVKSADTTKMRKYSTKRLSYTYTFQKEFIEQIVNNAIKKEKFCILKSK